MLQRGVVTSLAFLLFGCSTASDEELARERLEKLGYTSVALTPSGEGEFKFTATDDTGDKECRGTVIVASKRATRPRYAELGPYLSHCHVPTGK